MNVNKRSTEAQLLYLYIELEKKLSDSLYAQGAEAISEGIANSIKNIEKESNYFKEKAINRVLRISDDKGQELMDVIELLNNPQLTNKEVRGIKYYIMGYLNQKYKEKSK